MNVEKSLRLAIRRVYQILIVWGRGESGPLELIEEAIELGSEAIDIVIPLGERASAQAHRLSFGGIGRESPHSVGEGRCVIRWYEEPATFTFDIQLTGDGSSSRQDYWPGQSHRL